jgi:hypothetical protein
LAALGQAKKPKRRLLGSPSRYGLPRISADNINPEESDENWVEAAMLLAAIQEM